jgi:hypothetical protein
MSGQREITWPSKLGVCCEGENLTTSKPQQTGKLRPEYEPRGYRGREIIVINNSVPYYLCAGTTA